MGYLQGISCHVLFPATRIFYHLSRFHTRVSLIWLCFLCVCIAALLQVLFVYRFLFLFSPQSLFASVQRKDLSLRKVWLLFRDHIEYSYPGLSEPQTSTFTHHFKIINLVADWNYHNFATILLWVPLFCSGCPLVSIYADALARKYLLCPRFSAGSRTFGDCFIL